MRGCRFRADTGFEGQCDRCRQWWPLDADSWTFASGFRRCRACVAELRAAAVRELRANDPAMRARHRVSNEANRKAKRAADPAAFREYQRRWYAENSVRLMAETAERHLIRSELAGHTARRSPRDETPETLAFRADYRRRWIEKHGPVVRSSRGGRTADETRAANREWMRRDRAGKKRAA